MNRSLLTVALLAAALPLAPFAAAPVAAQTGTSVVIQVDQPAAGVQLPTSGAFGGWAVDLSFPNAPGISQVAVFMDGDATNGQFLGQAQLGGYRPDVAATYGNPYYANAGWSFNLDSLG